MLIIYSLFINFNFSIIILLNLIIGIHHNGSSILFFTTILTVFMKKRNIITVNIRKRYCFQINSNHYT